MRFQEQLDTDSESESPKIRKALSGWAKVALVFAAGALLVSATVVLYLTTTGFLPAAGRLGQAEADYRTSGAPFTEEEALAIFRVPKELNAALVVPNLSTAGPYGGFPPSTVSRGDVAKAQKKAWVSLLESIDQYGNRPHYRPASAENEVSESPDMIGSFIDQMSFRDVQRKLLEEALISIRARRYLEAMKFIERAIVVERWGMDRPALISKLIRLRNHKAYWELIGEITESLTSFPKLEQSLQLLQKAEEADLRLEDVSKLLAYGFVKLEAEFKRADNLEEAILEFRKGTKKDVDLADRLFTKVATSTLGLGAFQSVSLELGNSFYRTWSETKDIEKALVAAKRLEPVPAKSQFADLYAQMGRTIPADVGVNKALYERSALTKQLIQIATILGKRNRGSLARFTLSDLPKGLRNDPAGKPLQVRVVGRELRIYAVVGGNPAVFNPARGHGFRLRL